MGLFYRSKKTEKCSRQITKLVPKLRMSGILTSLSHIPSWHAYKVNFTFVIIELFDAACPELPAGSLNKP
jgi:hypothetical protein